MYDKFVEQLAMVRHFCGYIGKQVMEDRCIESAAALTFTTLLALVPMFTVLYAILAVIPSLRDAGDQLQDLMFQHFVPTSGVEIQGYLKEFSEQASRLTKFGVIFLFITAIMMMKRIEKSFNFIWRVPEPRKGVIGFMRYWAVLSLGPILVGLGLGITSYLASLKVVTDAVALLGVQKVGLSIIPFLLSWLAFTLVYLVVPNCSVPIRQSIYGGLIAAVAFEVAKRGFTLFVANFGSYQLVYGAFAALPLFLLWLYLSWIILLLGAVVTRALVVYRGSAQIMDPMWALLAVLHFFWLAQKRGEVVSEQRLLEALPRLCPETWQKTLRMFKEGQLIERTDQGAYLLSQDLHQVSLLSLLKMGGYCTDYSKSYHHPVGGEGMIQAPWYQAVRARIDAVNQAQESGLAISLFDLFSTVSDASCEGEAKNYLNPA